MKPWLLDLLKCPTCRADNRLVPTVERESNDEIVTGILACSGCDDRFPIQNGIPRFVAPDQNYSENFGAQWRAFRTIQVDRLSGHMLSERRFFADTRWRPEWLEGKLILDAGAGAGRFADVMAQYGARVVACDLSSAVDACRATELDPRGKSPQRGEIEVVQGDLLALPFRPGVFDAVHCAGVIQHLPTPATAMRAMPDLVKDGGLIFYNFYEVDPFTKFQVVKYLLRRTTPNWTPDALFRFSRLLCNLLFYPSLVMSRIPKVRFFNRFLPICAVHPTGIPIRQQYEMTLLDTIDWYGPKYEIRQDHAEVVRLLREEGHSEVASAPGLAWAVKGGRAPAL